MDSSTLQSAVVVSTVLLVMQWLRATRASTATVPKQDGAWLLSYPKPYRVIGGVFAAFPVALLILAAFVHPREGERWILWTLAGGFAAIFLPLAVEFFGVVHSIDQTGITSRTPWRRRRAPLPWSDVRSVRYNALAGWFVIRGRSGDVVRVSRNLSGIRTFADTLVANVPAEALDRRTRQRLPYTPKFDFNFD